MGYRLGYARVSTAAQDPQLQLDALAAAGVDEVYVDHASGVATSRPKLDELLRHARPGDTIVIWRLDRLGRSMKHLLELIEQLEQRNIALVSLNDQIDTTSANGRLILRLLASLAAFERDLLAERTKAGLEAARKQGRVGGRPKALSPAAAEAATTMYREGKKITQIADTLRVSRATIYRHIGELETTTGAGREPERAEQAKRPPRRARPSAIHGLPGGGL